jgi:glycosyltransferase involved in cell wall biosynthesis
MMPSTTSESSAPEKPRRTLTSTLLLVTLNEIDGMRAIMPQINREWVDQILLLDGGSTDGTLEYAREQGYETYVQKERGIRYGYNEILPLIRGEVLLTFSPDGNCIPEAIPLLLDKMEEGYDMVIASRYLPGAGSDDDDVVTGFGNFIFTATCNLLHHGHYTDVMGIYRAYKTKLIHELELDQQRWHIVPEKLFFTRISWEPLLSARAARRRLKVCEIPAREPARIGGVRKLQILRWGAAYYFQFIRDWFRFR